MANETEGDWEVGDVVRLTSGGPPMTVDEVINEGNAVRCVWFKMNSDDTWDGPYRSEFQSDDLVASK